MYHATLTVLRFELVRTFTAGRIAIWIMLCIFPSVLIALLRSQDEGNVPDDAIAIICYALVPQISCMLGLLLWATPAIGTELESQAWIYLTVRRHGRVGVALGKYIVAAAWTASYGIISAVGVSVLSGVEHPQRLAACLITLSLLASLAYSALYLLIGAAVYRRATVVAVVYSLLLEGLVSWVPATINKLTVSYRLRALLANWMGLDSVTSLENMNMFFGTEPAWHNVLALVVYTSVFLVLAVYVVRRREYPVQVEA